MEDFLWIALLIFYFVLQAVGGKKKKKQRQQQRVPPPQPEGAASQTDVSMQEALREIREALGMELEPPRPEPEPRTLETPPPSWETPRPEYVDEYVEPKPAIHLPEVRRGRQPAPLIPDDPFMFHEATASHVHRPRLIDVSEAGAARPSPAPSALLRRLQSPQAARDAFLLSEILGPPLSQRR